MTKARKLSLSDSPHGYNKKMSLRQILRDDMEVPISRMTFIQWSIEFATSFPPRKGTITFGRDAVDLFNKVVISTLVYAYREDAD